MGRQKLDKRKRAKAQIYKLKVNYQSRPIIFIISRIILSVIKRKPGLIAGLFLILRPITSIDLEAGLVNPCHHSNLVIVLFPLNLDLLF